MHNVNPTLQPLLRIPGAPPPTTPHDLQRLRSQAWAEVAAIEASDSRYHRALQDQQQYLQGMGVLS